MSNRYDPWNEAARLDLTVVERRMRHGHRGEYWHREKAIVLAPRMSYREARSVLTHELQHAVANDIPSPWGLITRRQELLARRGTALLLIDPDEYAQAEAVRGPHLAAIAHDLDVTVHVVRDWIAMREPVSA